MSKKLTPQQIIEREMKKLSDMGVTISTRSAPGASFEPQRPTSVITHAAKKAGIYEEKN